MKNYTTSVNFPIGTGGYTHCWTDKYPVTLVEVLSPSRVVVQDANATIISGSAQDGSAEYKYEPNPKGSKEVYSLRIGKNGLVDVWVKVGESRKGGMRLVLGQYEKYEDPHF